MSSITIIKENINGVETWRYEGQVLARAEGEITIEARFNRADMPFYEISLNRDDRFVETFYAERWYNIFEIHDRDDDHLKGWYCNITCPAVISSDRVAYIDLALDLLVYPDGKQLVLDEDEFAELEISAGDRERAQEALEELRKRFVVDFRHGD